MGRIQIVESVSGTGEVFLGEASLGAVRYKLTVYQTMIDAGTSEIPGLMEVRGSIAAGPENIHKMFGLDKLSLRLQDGRWLNFFLKNSRGEVSGTGGLYTR